MFVGSDGRVMISTEGPLLDVPALINLGNKFLNEVTYWGDAFTPYGPWIKAALVAGCLAGLAAVVKTSVRNASAGRRSGGGSPRRTTSGSAAARRRA